MRFQIEFHQPKFYRYRRWQDSRLRVGLNRYPGAVIGCYIAIGKYAYCLKWGRAR